jgi:hypothetical protein
MGVKVEVVKGLLHRIRRHIGEEGELAGVIAREAQQMFHRQLCLASGGDPDGLGLIDLLREAADAADPDDLNDEERAEFRTLAQVLEDLSFEESIWDDIRESLFWKFAGLDDAIASFRAWAARHGIKSPPSYDHTSDDDLVDLPRDEDGDLIRPLASALPTAAGLAS